MRDTKEKNAELSSDDMNEVSGGVMDNENFPDHRSPIFRVKCDVCGMSNYGRDSEERDDDPIIPFQGGHICLSCLKKVEEKLGRKIL